MMHLSTAVEPAAARRGLAVAEFWPRLSAHFTSTASWRRRIVAVLVVAASIVTWQRGVVSRSHTTFRIFRWSFWHLVAGENLYTWYPAEQGHSLPDLFKYSPTAALLFAPFAVMRYDVALFAWSLLNGLLLYYALSRLLSPERATIATLLALPDAFAGLQGCSSNGITAALIILAFVAAEHAHQARSSAAIAVGAALKIFPLAALAFAVFHPRRRRFALVFVGMVVALALLPLLVTPASTLVHQYAWWHALERSDAADLGFGDSVMRVLRRWTGARMPNWPVQLLGTAIVLAPLALRRRCWEDARFRVAFLASVLAYVVLFNHQAERQSFVIASTGVAIWFVSPPTGTTPTPLRAVLAVLPMLGLLAPPLLLVWVVMQLELYGWAPGRGGAWYALAAAPPRDAPIDDTIRGGVDEATPRARRRAAARLHAGTSELQHPVDAALRRTEAPYLSVIVPVWNAGPRLAATVEALQRCLEREPYASELLVIDDCSSEDASAALGRLRRDVPLTVLRNATNRGKGFAVTRGMLAARGHVRVFTDADMPYSAADVDAVVAAIEAGNDVAIGCRVLPESRYLVSPRDFPYLVARHLLSRSFNAVLRRTLVAGVLDSQAGLKGFTRAAAELIFPRVTIARFGFDVECLYIAQRHGQQIAQVPVVFHSDDTSTVHVLRDGARLLGDLATIRLNARRGRYD